MCVRTELVDPAQWPLSLILGHILRGIRLGPLPLKANKTCTAIEPSMVPDLLIRNFKTHRFEIELLCPLQIIEVEFNTDESRLNPLHKILSSASSIGPRSVTSKTP